LANESYIFTQLARKGRAEGITDDVRQRDTRSWFRNAAATVSSVNKNRMMNDKENLYSKITMNDIGKMYMYFYDPKHKDTLPYYDTFPLIFLVGFTHGGFQGINLHYLPPILRAKLMDRLYTISQDTKFNADTKLKLSYEILNNASKFKYFKPCFKMYLHDHVRSNFLNIQPRMWDAALMLPSARFKKASNTTVWKESQEMVG